MLIERCPQEPKKDVFPARIKDMGSNKYILRFFLVALMVCPIQHVGSAAVEPEQIKAALIVQFIRFVTWPDNPRKIRIGILSKDDTLFNNLSQLIDQSRVEQNFTVNQVNEAFNSERIDLLYVGPGYSSQLHTIAERARQTETLLVSDGSPFARDIMLNLINAEDRISFEVNRSNIVFESLQVDNEILLLGGSELDVAQLFRETEEGLKVLKQQLVAREQSLIELSDQIDAMVNDLTAKEGELADTNS